MSQAISNYVRIPAAELKTVAADMGARHRLEVPFFQADADLNPNGSPRPKAVRCVATVRVGSEFVLDARVETGPAGTMLAVSPQAYDLVLDTKQGMSLALPLLRALYVEMGRRYIIEQARQQSKGRN